jgi:hypothetical protein
MPLWGKRRAGISKGRSKCPDVVETEEDLQQYIAHLEAEREASAVLARLGLTCVPSSPVRVRLRQLACKDSAQDRAEEEDAFVSAAATEPGIAKTRRMFTEDAAADGKAAPAPVVEDAGDAETSPTRWTANSPRSVTVSTAQELLTLDVASANELRQINNGSADDAVSISPPTPGTPSLPQPAACKPAIGLAAPRWPAQVPC